MRILMLCSSYPLHAGDSASIFLQNLARALSDAGADIQVLAPDQVGVDESIHDPAIQLHHFQYFLPRRWQTLAYGSGILPNLQQRPWRWLQVPFFVLAMSLALVRLCRRERPDVIHAHWIIPQGLVAVVIAKVLKIPVVITLHGGDVFSLRGNLLGKLKQYALRHCQAWTANTQTTASALHTLGTVSHPHIVPMGVDVEQFAGDKADVGVINSKNNNARVILFVGRLVEKKGVSDLIDAYAKLRLEERQGTILWIIGDGTLRLSLERQAAALKIHDQVRFLGYIANDQLPAYYAAAEIFVAPSIIDRSGDTEGQGVVIIEAMASGVPVVAYKSGGIPDVISDEQTGLLVEPGNTQALSNAITRLLRDTDLRVRLGSAGREHVCRHYTWKTIAKQFMSIFTDVVNKGDRASR